MNPQNNPNTNIHLPGLHSDGWMPDHYHSLFNFYKCTPRQPVTACLCSPKLQAEMPWLPMTLKWMHKQIRILVTERGIHMDTYNHMQGKLTQTRGINWWKWLQGHYKEAYVEWLKTNHKFQVHNTCFQWKWLPLNTMQKYLKLGVEEQTTTEKQNRNYST